MAKNLDNKILPILITIILMLVVFAVSAFIAIQSAKIRQKTSLSQSTPSLTPTQAPKSAGDFEKICLENNGEWLATFGECEGLKREVCTKNHGIYEPCASACRHQPKTEVCIQVCVEVCDFRGTQQGGPGL